ncbi:hypothetical protein EMIT0P44_250010 [Pseudomonas sp. IT-P44]
MVEQLAFNQLVVGSNPTRPTIFVAVLKVWKAHESEDFRIFFCLEESARRGRSGGVWLS